MPIWNGVICRYGMNDSPSRCNRCGCPPAAGQRPGPALHSEPGGAARGRTRLYIALCQPVVSGGSGTDPAEVARPGRARRAAARWTARGAHPRGRTEDKTLCLRRSDHGEAAQGSIHQGPGGASHRRPAALDVWLPPLTAARRWNKSSPKPMSAPKPTMTVATIIRKPGKTGPAALAFQMQSLRSGISPKQWRALVLQTCKASATERRPPPRRKASCTGKPSARFPTDLRGLVPIASEPIRRLGFASPLGRDPARTSSAYHRGEKLPAKSRTSYFAQNRNFSFCADTMHKLC